MAKLSLRKKLLFISFAPTTIALLFMLGSNLFIGHQSYRDALENELLSTAKMLAFNSTALLEFGEKLAGVKLLEATSNYPDINYACIFDQNGTLFSEYHRPGSQFSTPPSPPTAMGTYFDATGIHLYHGIVFDGTPLGTIYLHSTLDGYFRKTQRETVTLLTLLFTSTLLALIFALRVQRLIYNPVTQLAGAARTISRTDDYSLRVIRQSDDELGDLVDQFNRMLRRIQEQNSSLKKEITIREATEHQLTAANEELQFEIGQRIQAEGQLEVLLDDLEKKNAELQDFAYVVSHDLKAPLRGISSLATWLIKDYGSKLDEKGLKYLEQLKERTKRMHTFIEGILQYSRLGRAQMNKELLNSRNVANQVIESFDRPHGITIHVAEDLPEIYYDKLFLIQVFQNLIGNALQHMGKPSGSIRITCSASEGFWEFAVADTGIGIEDRHHARIFRIFQSLNKQGEGDSSGIGLTLVKKIIERNGGEIRVESILGEGTTFCFTIPSGMVDTMASRTLTIYILDANEDYAKHTVKLLSNLGYKVRSTVTWSKGARVLEQGSIIPDVILIDPTGIRDDLEFVLRSICASYPDAILIACIPASGSLAHEASNDLRYAGVITKPFTLAKMNDILGTTHATAQQGD